MLSILVKIQFMVSNLWFSLDSGDRFCGLNLWLSLEVVSAGLNWGSFCRFFFILFIQPDYQLLSIDNLISQIIQRICFFQTICGSIWRLFLRAQLWFFLQIFFIPFNQPEYQRLSIWHYKTDFLDHLAKICFFQTICGSID